MYLTKNINIKEKDVFRNTFECFVSLKRIIAKITIWIIVIKKAALDPDRNAKAITIIVGIYFHFELLVII